MLPILWIKCICIIYTRTYKQPGSLKSFVLLLSNIFEVCNTPIFWRILFYSKIIDVMCGNVRPISISQTKTFWRVIPCDGNDTILLSTNYILSKYILLILKQADLLCVILRQSTRLYHVHFRTGCHVIRYFWHVCMFICNIFFFFSSSLCTLVYFEPKKL